MLSLHDALPLSTTPSWRSRPPWAGCSSAACCPGSRPRAFRRRSRTSPTSPSPTSAPRNLACWAWRRANPVGSLGLLRAREALLGLALVAFLYRVAHDALPSLFVLYGDYRFGWTARTVGVALAGVGVVSMSVQGGLVGAAVRRLGEPRALLAGLACGAVAFTLYGLAPTGALFLLGIPIGGLFGLTYPALQGLMTRRVGADEQGRLQGAIASVMGIAGVIAPVLFTQVFAAAIGRLRGVGVPGAPFLLAALLLVAAMVMVRRAASSPPVPLSVPERG